MDLIYEVLFTDFFMMLLSDEFFLALIMKEEFLWIFGMWWSLTRMGIWFRMDILILFINLFSLLKLKHDLMKHIYCFEFDLVQILSWIWFLLDSFLTLLPLLFILMTKEERNLHISRRTKSFCASKVKMLAYLKKSYHAKFLLTFLYSLDKLVWNLLEFFLPHLHC